MTKNVFYWPDCPAGYRTMPDTGLSGVRCPADFQKLDMSGRNMKAGHVRHPVSGRNMKAGHQVSK